MTAKTSHDRAETTDSDLTQLINMGLRGVTPEGRPLGAPFGRNTSWFSCSVRARSRPGEPG